jgi:hypothetical protein
MHGCRRLQSSKSYFHHFSVQEKIEYKLAQFIPGKQFLAWFFEEVKKYIKHLKNRPDQIQGVHNGSIQFPLL